MMNQADYNTLVAIRAKGQLTYTKADMERNQSGRPRPTDDQGKADIVTINEIMRRYDSTFVEFKSFTEDGRIRYDHWWDYSFTGVGYTKLTHLLHGLPLGNYSQETIERYDQMVQS